jgi:hypothetical protein
MHSPVQDLLQPIKPALNLLLPVYKDKDFLQSPSGQQRCSLGDLHYGPTALAIS